MFGSNNKFTSDDVLKRWKYIEKQAECYNIEIEGFASDGDTRCLKAMKIYSKLPHNSQEDSQTCPYEPYFQVVLHTE